MILLFAACTANKEPNRNSLIPLDAGPVFVKPFLPPENNEWKFDKVVLKIPLAKVAENVNSYIIAEEYIKKVDKQEVAQGFIKAGLVYL